MNRNEILELVNEHTPTNIGAPRGKASQGDEARCIREISHIVLSCPYVLQYIGVQQLKTLHNSISSLSSMATKLAIEITLYNRGQDTSLPETLESTVSFIDEYNTRLSSAYSFFNCTSPWLLPLTRQYAADKVADYYTAQNREAVALLHDTLPVSISGDQVILNANFEIVCQGETASLTFKGTPISTEGVLDVGCVVLGTTVTKVQDVATLSAPTYGSTNTVSIPLGSAPPIVLRNRGSAEAALRALLTTGARADTSIEQVATCFNVLRLRNTTEPFAITVPATAPTAKLAYRKIQQCCVKWKQPHVLTMLTTQGPDSTLTTRHDTSPTKRLLNSSSLIGRLTDTGGVLR